MLIGAHLLLLPAADVYICVCVYPISDLRIPGRISGLMCAFFFQPHILLSEFSQVEYCLAVANPENPLDQ